MVQQTNGAAAGQQSDVEQQVVREKTLGPSCLKQPTGVLSTWLVTNELLLRGFGDGRHPPA